LSYFSKHKYNSFSIKIKLSWAYIQFLQIKIKLPPVLLINATSMHLISFNLFRSLNIPGITYIKPEHWLRHRHEITTADWVLFPEYWQVNSLIYGYKKRIFPSPAAYHLGHDKVQMTRVFEALYPEHVPHTRITAADTDHLWALPEEFGYPFVAKEIRNSMGQGVFLIDSPAAWRMYAQANNVWYAQEYLPINRDLRVVIIGEQVAVAYWRDIPEGAFHANVARGGRVNFADVPSEALSFALQVARSLGIDHAGFDLVMVGNHLYLLEFNLYFGNQGLATQGVNSADLIYGYLSAFECSSHKC